jgi:hypothetical protein
MSKATIFTTQDTHCKGYKHTLQEGGKLVAWVQEDTAPAPGPALTHLDDGNEVPGALGPLVLNGFSTCENQGPGCLDLHTTLGQLHLHGGILGGRERERPGGKRSDGATLCAQEMAAGAGVRVYKEANPSPQHFILPSMKPHKKRERERVHQWVTERV